MSYRRRLALAALLGLTVALVLAGTPRHLQPERVNDPASNVPISGFEQEPIGVLDPNQVRAPIIPAVPRG